MKRLIQATINSWHGLRAAADHEAAFRQEIALLVLAIPAAFFVTPSPWQRLALIGLVFFTLIVELLNSAIERLADCITLENDPRIGRVKDMASAAVGLSLLATFIVWLVVLFERFY